MSKVYKIYERVLKVLKTIPGTRDNDNLLIATIDEQINPAVAGMPYLVVMSNRSIFGLPSCESIRRARQKAQETHPELKASKKMQEIRLDEEIQYSDFARSVNA